MVYINKFAAAQPGMPFGGGKNSGYGREHGGFGLKEFVNGKVINILKKKMLRLLLIERQSPRQLGIF